MVLFVFIITPFDNIMLHYALICYSSQIVSELFRSTALGLFPCRGLALDAAYEKCNYKFGKCNVKLIFFADSSHAWEGAPSR